MRFAAKDEELEIERKLIEAKAESKAKSEFLATMSHEIRTPMNGVLGMSELLEGTSLNTQQKQYLNVINSSAKSLLNIINDVLDYSKIIAGKMTIASEKISLEQLLNEVSSVFVITMEKKCLDFIVSIKPGTPINIQSDITRLRQILINLLNNAMKFTHRGKISLRVYESNKHCSPELGHLLRFEVTDTGIGIKSEIQEKLFEVFSQADQTTTRKYGGTGLGLSISKKLVEAMGGEIGVNSLCGQGSTFWFTIRCSASSREKNNPQLPQEESLQNKHILFVDQCDEILEAFCEQATLQGMHTCTAHSAEETITVVETRIQQSRPDLDFIVIDLSLSEISGIEIFRKIKHYPSIQKSKRILLCKTGITIDNYQKQDAGIDEAVNKPAFATNIRHILLSRLLIQNKENADPCENLGEILSKTENTRILVAEDNEVNQIVIKGFLKRLKLQYEIVSDGQQALNYYRNNHQDIGIVFMNCEMPVMDGYEAAKSIRSWEATNHIQPTPIVALSAHVLHSHQEKALSSGMNCHLSKPIETNALCRTIAEQLLSSVI